MLDFDLLKQVLVISIASGCVTTLTVQKIKEQVSKKKWLFLMSFFISIIIGTLFAKSFSGATWLYCIWAGFFTWIDANLLYSALESKVFKPFSEIKKTKKLERSGE